MQRFAYISDVKMDICQGNTMKNILNSETSFRLRDICLKSDHIVSLKDSIEDLSIVSSK